MKTHWFKRISIILTALFLLLALYVPAMAQKGTGRKAATPSDMEEEIEDMDEEEPEDEEDPDGYSDDGNVLPDLQEEEDRVVVSESKAAGEELPDAEEGLKAEADAAALTETKAAAATLPETGEKVTVKDFAGTWTIDGITSYRFREDGTGALILPEHTYTFKYTLEEGRLALKFENAKAGRVIFTAAPENGRLILVKEEEAGTAEFLLEKTGE